MNNLKIACQWCKSKYVFVTKVTETVDKWDGKQKIVVYYCKNKECEFNGTEWIQSIII